MKSPGPKALSDHKRRRSSVAEERTSSKVRTRNRNACDRCKQRKVKCDGEGVITCSFCQTGDHQCTYASKVHDSHEKVQYRKGYVEMVERANDYYKKGLHEAYQLFRDSPVFENLRQRYGEDGNPTAQAIVRSLGVESTGKPHEGGLESINWYLSGQNKPMMVRSGKWDIVQSSGREQASLVLMDGQCMPLSPCLSSTKMESPTELSSPLELSPLTPKPTYDDTTDFTQTFPTLARDQQPFQSQLPDLHSAESMLARKNPGHQPLFTPNPAVLVLNSLSVPKGSDVVESTHMSQSRSRTWPEPEPRPLEQGLDFWAIPEQSWGLWRTDAA